jgi:cell shape-determining protein MreC
LEQTRQQLDSAEREKTLLADRIHSCEESAKPMRQERQPRRRPSPPPGLHGDVLAVNQAYNFVVLNLGAGQGVEANSEMLVLRGRTVIGKIRVSSVEPATSIGDIIGSSLPRGVQVQTGDTVIYAGSGF